MRWKCPVQREAARQSSSANGVADMSDPHSIRVCTRADAERAHRAARTLASAVGLNVAEAEAVILATMELASNLVRYGTGGEMNFVAVDGPRGAGVQVESRDTGPGIDDVARALTDGFSTSGGLGGGLPAVRRLMDEFEIASDSHGTHVLVRKWSHPKSV